MIPYNIIFTLYPYGDLIGETSIIDTTSWLQKNDLSSWSAGSFQLIATIEGFPPAISPIFNITSNDIYKIDITEISYPIYANYWISFRVCLTDKNGFYSRQNSKVYLAGNFEIFGDLSYLNQYGCNYFNFYTANTGTLILTVSTNGVSESFSIKVLPDFLIINSAIPKVIFT